MSMPLFLGLSGRIMNGIIEEIVDFAEISDFIDIPVQSYSEGMKTRLGFSVAAHLNPDVMLVDEALAVGDLGFQRKCLKRISRYVSEGGILVFVSHNMHLIQSICQRSLVLDDGEVVFDGPTAGAIERYARLNESLKANGSAATSTDPTETNPVIIDALSVEAVDAAEICLGGSIRLTLAYRALRNMESVTWGFLYGPRAGGTYRHQRCEVRRKKPATAQWQWGALMRCPQFTVSAENLLR